MSNVLESVFSDEEDIPSKPNNLEHGTLNERGQQPPFSIVIAISKTCPVSDYGVSTRVYSPFLDLKKTIGSVFGSIAKTLFINHVRDILHKESLDVLVADFQSFFNSQTTQYQQIVINDIADLLNKKQIGDLQQKISEMFGCSVEVVQ